MPLNVNTDRFGGLKVFAMLFGRVASSTGSSTGTLHTPAQPLQAAAPTYRLSMLLWHDCRFIDQTGAETESVFGGQFKDDKDGLKLQHDRKGLLSMANMVWTLLDGPVIAVADVMHAHMCQREFAAADLVSSTSM